jgi:hypothetical protein
MKNLAMAVFGAALPLTACQSASPAGLRSDASDFVGYVTMRADRTLRMRVFRFPSRRRFYDYDLDPSNPSYAHAINQAGGLEPGQTRRLRRIRGSVTMAADGALAVGYNPVAVRPGDEAGTIPHVWTPPITIIRPGESGYAELVRQVGGLSPGETKEIYAAIPGTRYLIAP